MYIYYTRSLVVFTQFTVTVRLSLTVITRHDLILDMYSQRSDVTMRDYPLKLNVYLNHQINFILVVRNIFLF